MLAEIYGRDEELKMLREQLRPNKASLVVIRGRRRIGKSFLVTHFANKFCTKFINISGLAPHQNQNNQNQLENFCKQLTIDASLNSAPEAHGPINDWYQAFMLLESIIKTTDNTNICVLLDEISWMGAHDKNFASILKIYWDKYWSQHSQIVFVLCGSISTWIEENILKNSDFVGRISLELELTPLPLTSLKDFSKNKNISSYHLAQFLMLIGMIPKYLQEINFKQDITHEIERLFLHKSGALFIEFPKIFNEIFNHRAPQYLQILKFLKDKKYTPSELGKKIFKNLNGDITGLINDLILSGSVARDYVYHINGICSKYSKLRIKDNYLIFYLKYILPHQKKIASGLFKIKNLEQLGITESIQGLLFENIILNEISKIITILNIDPTKVVSASPYFQYKTTKNKGACQIDLLIEMKNRTFYLCEIKFHRQLDKKIVKEIIKKTEIFQRPRNYSIKTVLIYEGEIDPKYQSFFENELDSIIHFSEFFK